jgi:hypothetical protein
MSQIVRSATKQAILELLQDRTVYTTIPDNTAIVPQVTRRASEKFQSRERIWIGNATGSSEPAAMGGVLEDTFEIQIVVMVTIPGAVVEEAEDRCDVLVNDIVRALTLPATIEALKIAVPGLVWVTPSLGDGPGESDVLVGDASTHCATSVVSAECRAIA